MGDFMKLLLKLVLFLLPLFMFFQAVVLPVAAQAEQQVLRVVCDNYPPWKFKDANGQFVGIDLELLQIIAKKMDLRIECVTSDFRLGLKLLEAGDADIITNLYRRPEREEFLHFLEPPYLTHSDTVFYALKGNEHNVQRYADLKGKKVGVLKGVKYYPQFDEDTTIDKVEMPSFTEGVRHLLAGQIDVLINSEVEGDYMLASGRIDVFVVKSDFAYREPQDGYMAISKMSPLVGRLKEFNSLAAQIVKEGTVNRVKAEFLSSLMHPVAP